MAAPRRGTPDEANADEHLDELAQLADTAGAVTAGRLTQRLTAPDPHSYIGAGKLAQLTNLVQRVEASLVIFDNELSPAQGKNLESELGVRVMDRAELILDIFATRARSNEAKVEVELAQLEYLLPRLARMWVHFSRIRGGIGLRGPGETQLETDRRMIRRRIARLKQKLEKVSRHREVVRGGRRPLPTAALVGYTNAGKSSLLRALTGAQAFVENRLFATLDTKTRELYLGDGRTLRVVDTVGFIRKLPHHLVASFRATIEEANHAQLLLHVIDAAHPDWHEHVDVVNDVLDGLRMNGQSVVHVFNKVDLVSDARDLEEHVSARYDNAVCVAAERGRVAPLVALLRVLAPRHIRLA